MRVTAGRQGIINVLQVVSGSHIEVFRIVRSDIPEDPVFINSFRSNYELEKDPRGVERSSAVIHVGISTYLEQEIAVGTALRFEKLGDFVARVELRPGNGFNLAHTGHPKHLTIWGDPRKLSEAVVDIRPIER
jgi:hypothetical protein